MAKWVAGIQWAHRGTGSTMGAPYGAPRARTPAVGIGAYQVHTGMWVEDGSVGTIVQDLAKKGEPENHMRTCARVVAILI